MATSRLFIKLCAALPVEVKRRKEVDRHDLQKTFVLARLSVKTIDLTIPETIEVSEKSDLIEFTPIIITANPQPGPSTSIAPSNQTLASSQKELLDVARLSISYRKLKVFSGSTVHGKDEDPYHVWKTQAKALIEEAETEVSQAEKRRRLREALRSPALEVIDDLRRENPSATAKDYLQALEVVYGSTLTGEELFHQFFAIEQKAGETPSHYLSRLQGALRHVLQKGGIPEDKMNAVILKQFIRGIIYEPLLLVDLRLRELHETPPTYLTLLGKVRRWEEESNKQEKAKGQSRNSVAAAHTVSNNDLAERMSKIEKMLKHSSLGNAHVHQQQQSQPPPSRERRTNQSSDLPRFCYNCGQDGHMKRSCANQANTALVNGKLISHLHQQGNAKGHLRRGKQMSNKQD
ncbi:paraneoplastic antigen Ma1 homolog [Anneissia japonica]|uniref:paraneoplastic antigen Ma1 homolog n=1 Tax=Anneissia japonica TaxID=1529436 RepID=UPI0014256202|nr:paraneoplastic antigen Ma1 homolog [Anneissia japonica]